MDTIADDSSPPRPECEFDFNLPHGIDTEEGLTSDKTNPNSTPQAHGHQDAQTSMEPEFRENNPDIYQNSHDSMEDVLHSTQPSNNLDMNDKNNDEQDLNYGVLPKGFSDDEDAGEAFDRSWTGHQARRTPPKAKKSPRRPADDKDEEASPRTKRPRQSLFGGPVEDNEEEQPKGYTVEQDDDMREPKTPEPGIGSRMSSLNLEQQERERSPSERPFNLGFGLTSSDRGSMSPRASPAPSEESIIIPPDEQRAYELRQNIERKKAFTYIDTDKSGNFDPAEEAKQKTLKLQKAKAAKAAQQKKKGKQRVPKEQVMKCIVKLRFKAFGNVRNYTNDEDNWPDDWSDIDSDCEREMQEYRDFFRRNTPGREIQTPIEDPGGEVDDLTGYPAARGCRSCRKHAQDCSMIEGGTYPCIECTEDGAECEPILPPTMKGRCKQCAEDDKEVCSFEDDPDQTICDHCAENEFICEALPPNGYRAERIIIDEVIYGEDRPYVSCTVCRQEKKRCSLKKKTDRPPCKYCKKHHIGCTFFDLPKVDSSNKATGGRVMGPTEGDAPEVAMPGSDYFTAEDLADMNRRDEEMTSREGTPEIEMEDGVGRKGMLTKIKTSFAHPIQFGGLMTNTTDCNFCEIPTYGFVGLFEKEVHVIRWYNGLGYTEVGGGHAENTGPSTMCQNCTIGRAQIMACPQHDMLPVYAHDVAPGFEQVFEDLLEVPEGSLEMQQQLQRWCSMCFSPATFVCCVRQPSLFSSDEDEEEIEGCGLRLCAPCEMRLREVFDGDSSIMAATLDHEPKAKAEDEEVDGQVVRADVGFLSREGLLMKSLEHEADQADL